MPTHLLGEEAAWAANTTLGGDCPPQGGAGASLTLQMLPEERTSHLQSGLLPAV